jgi:DNA-directed RNA polymerase subunit RPC12/RpoP
MGGANSGRKRHRKKEALACDPPCEICGDRTPKLIQINKQSVCADCSDKISAKRRGSLPEDIEYRLAYTKHKLGV